MTNEARKARIKRLCRIGVAAAALLLPMTAPAQPNFVVLLVDDAGFMDFGGFGGEARAPGILLRIGRSRQRRGPI